MRGDRGLIVNTLPRLDMWFLDTEMYELGVGSGWLQ